MYYYDYSGHALVSLSPLSGFGPEVPPVTQGHLFAPVAGDPVLGRGSFRVSCPGQLAAPTVWRYWTPPACPGWRWTRPVPPPSKRAVSPP